ncbi:MAG: TIGR03862 family flavoprotein [Motiliproteus sp.]
MSPSSRASVAVIGAGPAGLMAAEVISAAGIPVQLFEAMGTIGRKFLLAGRSGLNITHDEPLPAFIRRYGAAADRLAPLLSDFDPLAIRAWVQGLGIETFVGGAGRVFPEDRKAAPLLRAWRQRLEQQGVEIHPRHRWQGWAEAGRLRFVSDQGECCTEASAVVLALGGGSWPRMGSDGQWVELLRQQGIDVAALAPSNCGFNCAWSEHFASRFSWQPLKSIQVAHPASGRMPKRADLMVTAHGIEGGAVYALTAALRAEIETQGHALLHLDLTPDRTQAQLEAALATPRGKTSMATHLKRRVGIQGIKASLLRELAHTEQYADPVLLAAAIKQLPLPLVSPRPLAEAISSAGGVLFSGLTTSLMVNTQPGLFVAGEMLDWEAPTGGYLLSGCLATGRAAGLGAVRWLQGAD